MNNYQLDITKEELIECCAKDLILKWCEKNHPQIIQEIKQKLEKLYDECKQKHFNY